MNNSNVPIERQVGLTESLVLFFKNYLNFSGRSGPSAYWWYMLWSLIFLIPLGLIDSLLLGITSEKLFSLSNLFGWVTLIPGLALSFRRLHDINKSAWWLLMLFTVIGFLVLIYWATVAGDRQENSYGADTEAGKSF